MFTGPADLYIIMVITIIIIHSEFFAKNRVSGKYCEIQSNTVKHKNRKTEKQRKPEWVGVCRFVCIVIFKFDYSSETANIHLLKCS